MNIISGKLRDKKQSLPRRAFTVIEILVASALMSVIVTIVLGMVSQVLNVWENSSGRLSSNFNARICMDNLVKDLQSAIFRNNGDVWLSAKIDNINRNIDGASIKFFTTAMDRDTGTDAIPIYGDICAVSYQMKYANPINTNNKEFKSYGFYRALIDSKETFDNYMGKLQEKPNSAFLPDSSQEAISAAFLAENVVGFKLVFWLKRPNGQYVSIDLEDEGEIEFPYESRGNIYQRPEYIDVSLNIVTDEGIKQIEAYLEGNLDIDIDEIKLKHGKTYSQRITFFNNPL